MSWGGVAWVAGGYLVGTLPSTWLVARWRRAPQVEAASARGSSVGDAHTRIDQLLGTRWSALAAAADVLKGLLFVLAARWWGDLPDGWLAAAGVAVVVGHSFPFYLRDMSGRGLAAASGVLLALLPIEMVVAGLLIVAGIVAKNSGLASTIGMAVVAPVAAVQGQPGAFVAMAAGIFLVIMLRRLDGVGGVIRTGIGPAKAVWYRCVLDTDGPPVRKGTSPPGPPG